MSETNKVNESNQWQLSGNCSKCRRAQYCTKSCTAKKKHVKSVIGGVVDRVLGSMLPPGVDRYY